MFLEVNGNIMISFIIRIIAVKIFFKILTKSIQIHEDIGRERGRGKKTKFIELPSSEGNQEGKAVKNSKKE